MKINIIYDVMTSFVLTIERDELPKDHDDLLQSVTRAELNDCPMQVHEIEWDNIKEAWLSSTPDNTTVYLDEEPERSYPYE